MAIVCNQDGSKRVIDLQAPEGNAFAILGLAKQLCAQMGLDAEAITAEMTAGGYGELVRAFDKHFGDLYDILDRNGEYQ